MQKNKNKYAAIAVISTLLLTPLVQAETAAP
jgi:hypothetical protein